MSEIRYQVGEIRNAIRESASQFSPKMAEGAKEDNKKSSEEFYKKIEKETKDLDGGPKKDDGQIPPRDDRNKGVMDYTINNADDSYKERVKAQCLGYTSKKERDAGTEKIGEFEKNKALYKQGKEKKEVQDNAERDMKLSGLATSKQYEMDPDKYKEDTMYEGKLKRLHFKHTNFVNEGYMLSRIPESFKNDGERFWMKDCGGNEYLIEWTKKGELNEGKILKHVNKQIVTEQMDRIKLLFGYNPSEYNSKSTSSSRVNEEKEFGKIMDKVRG